MSSEFLGLLDSGEQFLVHLDDCFNRLRLPQ